LASKRINPAGGEVKASSRVGSSALPPALFRPAPGPATARELALDFTRRRPRDAWAWRRLASALIDLNLFSDARRALERMKRVAVKGEGYMVAVAWGNYYASHGDFARAEGRYRRAAAISPAALVILGGLLARQGKLLDAERCHRRATRARADRRLARDEGHLNLALIARARRRYPEALVSLQAAITIDRKYLEALSVRRDVRAALKAIAPQRERTHWRWIMRTLYASPALAHELTIAYTQRYPREYAGWVVLAIVLGGFGRRRDAAVALGRAQRAFISEARHGMDWQQWKEPPAAFFARQWGELAEANMDGRGAERWYRRAVKAHASTDTLTSLARVLVRQGRFAAAERYLARAIGIDSGDLHESHYLLALIARARRRYPEALAHVGAALRAASDFPVARQALRDVRSAMRISKRD
jgi:tetratricopeptide (TPR) repeat protein